MKKPMIQRVFIFSLCMAVCGIGKGQKKVTFAENVAPIIFKNCAPCHHEGTAAPFSLLTYQDVAKRASMIQKVTHSRYMPPWKADPTYRSFANEKMLSENEIEVIRQWVDLDMPKGNLKKMLPVPAYSKSALTRSPDITLRPLKQYIVRGDGKENFVLFVIPFEFEKEMNVEAIEFASTNFKAVHHSNFGIYAVDPSIPIYGDSNSINSNDLMMHANRYQELTKEIVYYNGWIPGASPIVFPKEIGFKIPKRGVIILTNHYSPSSIDHSELSSLNLFFTSAPVKRTVQTLSIGSGGVGEITPPLILLPNEVSKFRVQMSIVKPLSILYVWPHMHLLGKSFKAYYVTSIGDTVPLVRINKWDFNWQEAYKFKKLMKLPVGSVLTVEGEYDNTSNNPRNPFNPPKLIFSDGLMETKNEMLSLIIVYLSYKEGDENIEL